MNVLVDPEFESLVPPLTEEERGTLEQGLLREGCRDALVAWQPPEAESPPILLDGHHRLALCQEHRIAYTVALVDLPDRQAAIEWMVTNQLGRRNLPPYARAELALKLEPLTAARARAKQQKAGREKLPQNPAEAVDTREELARVAGVSHDTIAKARVLAEKAPALVKSRLRCGETTINKEYDLLRGEMRRQEKHARKTAVPELPESTPRYHLIQGALAGVGCQVADATLDCIITDPPYAAADLPLYSELSEFSARTLKPGGSLLVMAGQLYLPEVVRRLGEHLQYRWTMAYLLRGPHSAVWPVSVRQQWKPILWFTNGERHGHDRVADVIRGDGAAKEHHVWGHPRRLGRGQTGTTVPTRRRSFGILVGADVGKAAQLRHASALRVGRPPSLRGITSFEVSKHGGDMAPCG
jgi:hypothetical protein